MADQGGSLAARFAAVNRRTVGRATFYLEFTFSSPVVHGARTASKLKLQVSEGLHMIVRVSRRMTGWVTLLLALAAFAPEARQAKPPMQKGPGEEISTEQLERILADGSARVLDARPYLEYAISHIPGAVNVAPKPGVPISIYVSDVAEIGRLVKGDKAASLILYCNGVHCGKSRRLVAELRQAGYTDVRRYQLGIPMWRAAGGVCQVELDGLRHILEKDGTAVVIDSREASAFEQGTLPGARNIPRSLVLDGKDVGEVKRAKDDGRLPMEDHNTRVLVVGADAATARYVAEALAREAFHNVSYFAGSFESVRSFLTP
jgi:rhodanese-related sulfurtransferase